MSTGREERLALNEAVFRAANERSTHWEERREDAPEAVEIYHCECARMDCRQTLRLRRQEYERVRSDPMRFVIAPGHEIPDIEDVVERHDDWVIIAKHDDARDVAESTDPRG